MPWGPFELCKNRAGYESEPEPRLALDLDALERELPAKGLEPLANAGVILVVRTADNVEVSIFESGKLLVKSRDLARAEAAFRAVAAAIGHPAA